MSYLEVSDGCGRGSHHRSVAAVFGVDPLPGCESPPQWGLCPS